MHEGSALEGQTAAPSREDHVNLHFIAFVHHKGGLYELGKHIKFLSHMFFEQQKGGLHELSNNI